MSKDGVPTYKNLIEPYLVQKLVVVRLVGSPPFVDKRVSGDVVRVAAADAGVRPILATSSASDSSGFFSFSTFSSESESE